MRVNIIQSSDLTFESADKHQCCLIYCCSFHEAVIPNMQKCTSELFCFYNMIDAVYSSNSVKNAIFLIWMLHILVHTWNRCHYCSICAIVYILNPYFPSSVCYRYDSLCMYKYFAASRILPEALSQEDEEEQQPESARISNCISF